MHTLVGRAFNLSPFGPNAVAQPAPCRAIFLGQPIVAAARKAAIPTGPVFVHELCRRLAGKIVGKPRVAGFAAVAHQLRSQVTSAFHVHPPDAEPYGAADRPQAAGRLALR